jgi:hypothetical protein
MVLTVWEAGRCRKKKRGLGGQLAARALEREIKKRVLAVVRLLGRMGYTNGQAARRLGLNVRTLGTWKRQWREDRMKIHARGRPVEELDTSVKTRIVGMMDYYGPHVGLPTLRSIFPEVARAELEAVMHQYRRVYLRKNSILTGVLRWTRPGAVWAVDFTYAPRPIDGAYKYVLLVRDLASGANLLWLPVASKDGKTARDAVRALFLQHGPPLAVKADNDGPFRGSEFESELGEWDVMLLPSPVEMPWYNGSCEAGVGSAKTHTHHEAARHGRPGEWTCDDVETARLKSNEISRPFGGNGPTAEKVWRTRKPITEDEREEFRAAVAHYVDEIREEKAGSIDRMGWQGRAAIERQGIVRGLVRLGYLEIRRRRISPPIKSKKWERIS